MTLLERGKRGKRKRSTRLNFSKKRLYRRRRRRAFFSFCALAVLAGVWMGVASPPDDSPSRADGELMARLDAPSVAQAPKAVSEKAVADAREKKAAAEKRATAEEKAAAEKAEAEKKAAKEDGEKAKEKAEKKKDERQAEEGPLPPAPSDPTMYLTIPKLGLYDNTVFNDDSPWMLDQGAVKIPSTGFPWQDNANTYIAGHRVGYAGTQSYNQFYNLPSMQPGDEVILEDANGSVYTYRVTDVLAVTPQDTWVTHPQPGRDMVTLQTCVANVNDWWTITPGLLSSPPGPETARLIVQAERVDIQPA